MANNEKKQTQDSNAKDTLKQIWQWVYKLRSVILAVPVAIAAVVLAVQNTQKLPATVGFGTAGTEAGQLIFKSITVSRELAVFAPLVLTAVCIVMMFCSKRVTYPWLISLFTLALPLLLLLINTFP